MKRIYLLIHYKRNRQKMEMCDVQSVLLGPQSPDDNNSAAGGGLKAQVTRHGSETRQSQTGRTEQ